MRHPGSRSFLFLLVAVLASGCGGRAYVFDTSAIEAVERRADVQRDGDIRVSAAVPAREETAAIFGQPLYDQGIQPVWLEIENGSPDLIRYAPVSTDSAYFPPFEVAYKNRGGLSDEARTLMERHLNELSMPRYVDAGETRSGFVFTHLDKGAKGFNVDIFGSGKSHYFNFLLRVPGFVPDYADIKFNSIYPADERVTHDDAALYATVQNMLCCSLEEDGKTQSAAVNLVLIGKGVEVLTALLRSNWRETSADEAARTEPDMLFGRKQDAIFRYETPANDSLYELRLWLAPNQHHGVDVWAGQVRQIFRIGRAIQIFDPDVDHARLFAFQTLLYGQGLQQFGWVSGAEVVPVESFWRSFTRPPFFTDGYRLALWPKGEPVSMRDIKTLNWDLPPGRKQ